MGKFPIETTRLILRNWKESDLKPFAEMNSSRKVMEFFPSTLSEEESNSFAHKIMKIINEQGWGLWAVEVKGITPFIGFIGFHRVSFNAHFTPAIEIGYRLDDKYWGQGYALEGAKAAIKYGFDTLNFKEIVAFTSKLNRRSIQLMERLQMAHKEEEEFTHPRLPQDHYLAPHVLYRKKSGK